MAFVLIGLALLVMKWAEFGPVAAWSWWVVLLPFAAAAAWWQYSDAVGLTQKREMDKMDARKAERRKKHLVNLGMDERGRRHSKDKPQG